MGKTVRSENLAAFMKANRGSQQKIAAKLKVTPPTVSQWKSGKRPVPSEYVPIICEILGITENDLYLPFGPAAYGWSKTEQGQMLLKILPDLSDEELDHMLLEALQLRQSRPKQKTDS